MKTKLHNYSFRPPTLLDSDRWSGMRIGLLGGSFNPPHAGHLHIARMAQIQFGLDFVWWIVTPQNPLKDAKHICPYEERFQKTVSMLAPHPRQIPTHLEAQLGTHYTYQTLSALRHHYPKTDFLWICGMDNAHIFHQWDHWQSILEICPITFIARPPAATLVKNCPVRMQSKIPQFYATHGAKTDLNKSGIYWIKGQKMVDISSTKIRKS